MKISANDTWGDKEEKKKLSPEASIKMMKFIDALQPQLYSRGLDEFLEIVRFVPHMEGEKGYFALDVTSVISIEGHSTSVRKEHTSRVHLNSISESSMDTEIRAITQGVITELRIIAQACRRITTSIDTNAFGPKPVAS